MHLRWYLWAFLVLPCCCSLTDAASLSTALLCKRATLKIIYKKFTWSPLSTLSITPSMYLNTSINVIRFLPRQLTIFPRISIRNMFVIHLLTCVGILLITMWTRYMFIPVYVTKFLYLQFYWIACTKNVRLVTAIWTSKPHHLHGSYLKYTSTTGHHRTENRSRMTA